MIAALGRSSSEQLSTAASPDVFFLRSFLPVNAVAQRTAKARDSSRDQSAARFLGTRRRRLVRSSALGAFRRFRHKREPRTAERGSGRRPRGGGGRLGRPTGSITLAALSRSCDKFVRLAYRLRTASTSLACFLLRTVERFAFYISPTACRSTQAVARSSHDRYRRETSLSITRREFRRNQPQLLAEITCYTSSTTG